MEQRIKDLKDRVTNLHTDLMLYENDLIYHTLTEKEEHHHDLFIQTLFALELQIKRFIK